MKFVSVDNITLGTDFQFLWFIHHCIGLLGLDNKSEGRWTRALQQKEPGKQKTSVCILLKRLHQVQDLVIWRQVYC